MIRIQEEDFDLGDEYTALKKNSRSPGAIVTFTGLVRDLDGNEKITGMTLEYYPGMTEQSLAEIISEAKQRWRLDQIKVIHRVGKLVADDQIVFVGVSSAHREEAFLACRFIMDYLKTRAQFWKKETTTSGERWVDAKSSDRDSAEKWKQ
ncbi:molybdopterin synthase catalytic subunit MoaE [Aurantivibrio infirmus]